MMNTVVMVKVAITVYVIFAVFAVVILWRNPSGSSSLQNAGVLVAALLPALIAILPLNKTTELKEEFNLVLFFDEDSHSVAQTGLFSPYQHAYLDLFVSDDPIDFIAREIDDSEVPKDTAKQYWPTFHHEKGFDLIERLVLRSFVKKFYAGWDLEFKTVKTPLGEKVKGQSNKINSTTFPTSDLVKQLEHNLLVKDKRNTFIYPSFELPLSSKISFFEEGRVRRIVIETVETGSVLTLSIHPSNAEETQTGVWGLIDDNRNLAVLEYEVVVTLNYRPNAVGGEKIRRWYENISSVFTNLDWKSIDENVEKRLMRQMLNSHDSHDSGTRP